jgi:hypothetical protein
LKIHVKEIKELSKDAGWISNNRENVYQIAHKNIDINEKLIKLFGNIKNAITNFEKFYF